MWGIVGLIAFNIKLFYLMTVQTHFCCFGRYRSDMYNHEQSTNHKTLQSSKSIMNAVFILRNSSPQKNNLLKIDSQDIQEVGFFLH